MRDNQSNGIAPSIFMQALKVNKKPFPWLKAFSAGLAAALPVLIGLAFGQLQYGLIAGLGGFAYLYVFNIPYAQRAKKIFCVVLGLTLVTYLGSISAPYPLAVAILMGIIGAAAIFVFGALKIAGPSAIFFVLVFAMATGMPINPDEAFLRAGLVFLSGCLSWIIAMAGLFFNPHSPETGVVTRVYLQLADLLDSVGTTRFTENKHKVMEVLRDSEETLSASYIPWRTTDMFNRLYLLNISANELFIKVVEKFSNAEASLPKELGESARLLAHSLEKRDKREKTRILQPDKMEKQVSQLFSIIYNAEAILNEPISKINKSIQFDHVSLKTIFMGAFDKNSIVFISSVRFGVITAIAAIIAYQLDFARSYWVPLSCVAVMSGATIVSTFHRAIQRFIGTVIGIVIAGFVLSLNPSGFVIVLFIFGLTFVTELFIVKNYGLAALFFTPNALLMAESTSEGMLSFAYFAEARFIDIIIGSGIGLLGVYLTGRKSASSRIPHLLSKTLRSQAQFLFVLFSDQGEGFAARKSRERMKMRTNINNLQTLYTTASGEIPANRKALDYYWPVIFTVKHLGYLLKNCSKENNRPNLSDEKLAQILLAFEAMANAATRNVSPKPIEIPEIEGFPGIQKEIQFLQKELGKSRE
ncbi:membrane protein [Mesobacillus campisalis]|uniref:Membrane protein n=1 Tax=Mesobacillus campisalis TaxID=1408103 RepID=A0A0M2T1U1_9BACI|nr:FUSC family protein [Mesobacillus campisalis]KKK39931.1 membrane protein [Mesobacillus campisalis]